MGGEGAGRRGGEVGSARQGHWPPATPGEEEEEGEEEGEEEPLADRHGRGFGGEADQDEMGEAGSEGGEQERAAPRTWEELQRRSDLHARRAAETAAAAAAAAATVHRLESLFRLPSASASASPDDGADPEPDGADPDDVRYPMGEA